MIGIIGKKIGMTQIFTETGERIPITLISAGPCPILQVKRPQRDGYSALQIGYGEKRQNLLNKPLKGHLKKANIESTRVVREVRIDNVDDYKEGQILDCGLFQPGDHVDVIGVSIGKGFQGGVKRWGWAGGKASHGSMHHRAPGSIGASSFPSRVTKGHHMPGRMGAKRITVQNLEVVKVDKEKNLIALKGSLPGNQSSFLMIKEARKMPIKREPAKSSEQDKKQA